MKDISDLPNGRASSDIEWIDYLKRGKDWTFFTQDRRILKNPAEKAALRSAGLCGFILANGFKKMPLNEIAWVVLWKWPDIEMIIKADDPAIFEIQVNRRARPKSIFY